MTLIGIERLARNMETGAAGDPSTDYSRVTLAEADHTARFVAGCYAGFPRFHEFASYSMCYFAAASHSEMLRRLGRQPPGFLRAADPEFAAAVERLAPATHARDDLATLVGSAVERINVAGLCDPAKRNWYGVDLEDAVRAGAHRADAGGYRGSPGHAGGATIDG